MVRGVSGGRATESSDSQDRKKALTVAILHRIVDLLEASGAEVGFVLFEGDMRTSSALPVKDWRWRVPVRVLQERSIPFLRTRDVLRARAAAEGRSVRSYFGTVGVKADHFNEDGNRVVAAALVSFADKL